MKTPQPLLSLRTPSAAHENGDVRGISVMMHHHAGRKTLRWICHIAYLCAAVCLLPAQAATPAIISDNAIFKPVQAQQAMVVADEPLAARIGLDLLRQGGNAVDAAVAIGFAMAVTYPRAGNIGGGGFMLIHQADKHRVTALDYRETAPQKAHRDLFLDAQGQVDGQLSRFSPLAVGVPGTVAGLLLALEKYGSLPLSRVLTPAIQLAREGFPVSPDLHQALQSRRQHLSAAAQQVFYHDGQALAAGQTLVQKDLAATLQRIAEQGRAGFYSGDTARLLIADMTAHGGIMSLADLAQYQPVLRTPVQGEFRGYQVYSMSPPSSGGVHIVQLLNLLSAYDLRTLGHNSAATIHYMAEAMKYAYADRAKYLGDPDFVSVPVAGLTALEYAQQLRKNIDPQRVTPSKDISAGQPPGYESPQTTHFSVMDAAGNAVANTYTLNFSFGSGLMAPGTGFLLNNEMDDFSAKPGVPNAYGLVGGEANAVAPGKRMLSSMSPTIVLKDQKPFLITGSPGGSRIITTTLQIILNVIEHGLNLQEAVNAVRVHHQWWPDELSVEQGLSVDTYHQLQKLGHKIKESPWAMGAANSILRAPDTGRLHGAADPRRSSAVAVGF